MVAMISVATCRLEQSEKSVNPDANPSIQNSVSHIPDCGIDFAIPETGSGERHD